MRICLPDRRVTGTSKNWFAVLVHSVSLGIMFLLKFSDEQKINKICPFPEFLRPLIRNGHAHWKTECLTSSIGITEVQMIAPFTFDSRNLNQFPANFSLSLYVGTLLITYRLDRKRKSVRTFEVRRANEVIHNFFNGRWISLFFPDSDPSLNHQSRLYDSAESTLSRFSRCYSATEVLPSLILVFTLNFGFYLLIQT